MAISNAEKQKRHRIRNELVLRIYEAMTDTSRHEIRRIARILEDFSPHFDMEDDYEKE